MKRVTLPGKSPRERARVDEIIEARLRRAIGVRRKSGRKLSAKTVAEITGAIDHLETAIDLYRQVLAADNPAIELSWRHAAEFMQ